jgi:SWI/SNF-related matrix-associated actin-dependent regulator of chromatin subfamily A-like protein 1
MPNFKLMPHQIEALHKINKFKGRAIIADEMGLGKTVEALFWVKLKKEYKLPLLIVSPAVMKWTWANYVHDILKMPCTVLQGRSVRNLNKFQVDLIYIINYDILHNWETLLKKMKFKTLILDESHCIKSKTTKRYKAICKITKDIPYTLALSGTPLLSRPEELFTTLKLIDPVKYRSFYIYAHRYCKPVKKPWGWEYKGASNLSELHTNLKNTMMIRRLKKDVLDLPEKMREIIPLSIDNEKEYIQIKNNFLAYLSKISISKAMRAEKAQTLVQLGYLIRTAAIGKLKQAIEWVDNFLNSEDEKIVLFATHKKVISILEHYYKNKCVVIDGSTPTHKRPQIVQAFQSNDKIKVFIGNIKAAGEGITLTAASTVAFIELDWTPGKHLQAEDRLHRISQKNTVSVYYLVAKDTIEEKLGRLLSKKQEIIERTLDGKYSTKDFNIFNDLEKYIKGI